MSRDSIAFIVQCGLAMMLASPMCLERGADDSMLIGNSEIHAIHVGLCKDDVAPW